MTYLLGARFAPSLYLPNLLLRDDLRNLEALMVAQEKLEDCVYLVKAAAAVEGARTDAFLEGVILAHEQVQDQRIKFALTHEVKVDAADVLLEVVFTFFLQSPTLGKALSNVAQKVLRAPISNQKVVDIIASESGYFSKALQLQHARQMLGPEERITGVFARSLSKAIDATREVDYRTDISAFRAALFPLATLSPGNWSAAAKAGVAGGKKAARDSRPMSLGGQDSVGVATLSGAYDAHALSKLALDLRTARFEYLLRSGRLSTEDVAALVGRCLDILSDLTIDIDGGKPVPADLAAVRRQAARAYEPVIWTREYRFSKKNRYPLEPPNKPAGLREKPEITGVDPAVVPYWFERFGDLIDEWPGFCREVGGFSEGKAFHQLPQWQQCHVMWRYMMAVSESVPEPPSDKLSSAPVRKDGQ